ncbi:Gfo/Idh/MocA family oxidoreductase [bacterium]|nr:Gfo/Idh/MocA family oxidoreductase [bacterium]
MSSTRRGFLKSTLGLAGPLIVPSSVLGKEGATPPNERVQLGCIGVGGMGSGNLSAFLQDKRVEVLGICDVDANHRAKGLETAGLKPEAGTGDFRELIAREDIDAVMIATPDHWHALMTGAAIKSGKDVYCEKPLAASVVEGRYVCRLAEQYRRVIQCGTWRRSGIYTRMACEWVRNGYIGKLQRIEVGVPAKFEIRHGKFTGLEKKEIVPKELDYEMWLGPAPNAPYTAARCHFNFRWITDYAPGYITDWGAHFLDVAQWGNDTDDTAPISVAPSEVVRREHGIYNAPEAFRLDYRYANGVEMTMISTADQSLWGTKFIGEEGSVFTENTKLITDPAGLRTTKLKPTDEKLYESSNHHRNFIDSVYSREATAAPAEAAHRAATCCHLGGIASATGKEIQFDPETETITNSDKANGLLKRKMRGDWQLT